jgi:hypothetical protein
LGYARLAFLRPNVVYVNRIAITSKLKEVSIRPVEMEAIGKNGKLSSQYLFETRRIEIRELR